MIRKSNLIRLWCLGLSACLWLTANCVAQQNGSKPHANAKAKAPRLVVGIVVDQMRYDYLERFAENFGEGGFKRLLGEGTSYANCNYNYVPTETAPGHASIFTGTTPSGHGIIMNEWLDQSSIGNGKPLKGHSSVADSLYPFVGASPLFKGTKFGASPLLLESTTMADELEKATKCKAKTIGVSLKDRSAILPVSKSADAAFWFDDISGNMISSTYYPNMKAGLPAWVDSINQLHLPFVYLSEPKGWDLLLPAAKYTSLDGPADSRYEGTYGKDDVPTFPHRFVVDPHLGCPDFKTSPWGNVLVKDFAKQAIIHYQLGADKVTDFLSVSFSSTDMVAHQFGTQSREVEDTYLRLDRDLADFLNFLDQRIGKENVLVFLTADHGGALNPVFAQDEGALGGWIDPAALTQLLHSKLGDRVGQDSLLASVKGHTVYLNRALATRRGLDLDSLSHVVTAAMVGFPGIEKGYTAREMAAINAQSGPESFLKNGFNPTRSGDVAYLADYGYLQSAYSPKEPWRYQKGTSHGSHYDYDTHVPLLWWGWKTPISQNNSPVVIPDIAPTVCKALHIQQTSKCSGKPVPGL